MDSTKQDKRDRLRRMMRQSQAKASRSSESEASTSRSPADSGAGNYPQITPDWSSRYESFGLTGVQQAYLLGRSDSFVLGNIATHNYFDFIFDGLDFSKFQMAWNRLIDRHDMLRAVFSEDGTQRVLQSVSPTPIALVDLSSATDSDKENTVHEIRQQMSHQVFDVETWPLYEIRVTRLTEERYRIHFSIDLLIADAASTMLLIRELDTLYDEPDYKLPSIDVSFRDFILMQDELEKTDSYKTARDYWRKRAPSLSSGPELPLAKKPEEIDNPRFKRREFSLDANQWGAFKQQAKTLGATPTALLLTLYGLVLNKWSKSSAFTLNLTMLNRLPLHPDINRVVGDFTSLVLLELNFSDALEMSQQVKDTQSRLWRELEHRLYDGVDVLRDVNRHYGANQSISLPIVFTSALGLEGSDAAAQNGKLFTALADINAKDRYSVTQSSQVWLDCVVRENQGELGVSWDSLDQLFPDGVLDEMFRVFCSALEKLGSQEPISKFNFEQLSRGKPDSSMEADMQDWSLSEDLLHTGFERQLIDNEHSTAVICGEHQISYRQLNNSARSVVDFIDSQSTSDSPLVAIVMDKSWHQLAAALGILIAGKAYLPINAELPEGRIHELIKLGGANVVVTRPQFETKLPNDCSVFCLDQSSLTYSPRQSNSAREVVCTDLAYVIFTSGSTGEPKGVMIDHRGAVNTIRDINDQYNVSGNDRVLALSSLSFDLSVYDVFGLLAVGGCVVIPTPDEEKEPDRWVRLVKDHRVTLWNTVPTLAQMLTEEIERTGAIDAVESLRLYLLSGDWIPLTLPGVLRTLSPASRVISLGGATEASIWSISYEYENLDDSWQSIPYGVAMRGQQVCVLDKSFSVCSDWVTGDIYLSGIGLSLGYWMDQKKTDSAFIEHPRTGQRLYRTGDLGRYMGGSVIEFLGREDSQVKIKGNRVELGEITAKLDRAEGIRESAVIARSEDRYNKRLIAYVVADVQGDDDAAPTARDVPFNADIQIPVLVDPMERAAFSLSQPGLRTLTTTSSLSLDVSSDAASSVFELPVVTTQSPTANDIDPSAKVELSQINGGLSVLRQFKVADHALPKRAYPSAGSLYPVQVYLQITQSESDAGELLYYSPAENSLVRVDADPSTQDDQTIHSSFVNAAKVAVVLVTERQAVEPIYGGFFKRFSLLEAGHLTQLLRTAFQSSHVHLGDRDTMASQAMASSSAFTNSQAVLGVFPLSVIKSEFPVETKHVNVLSRQSYRQYIDVSVPYEELAQLLQPSSTKRFDVYLHGQRGDSSAMFYRYCPDSCDFEPVVQMPRESIRQLHGIENQSLAKKSNFTLFFVSQDTHVHTLLAAGELAQSLMLRGPGSNLGFCPVGNVSIDTLRSPLQLEPSCKLIYVLEGGMISDEQKGHWAESTAKNITDDLRTYLEEKLPGYMVPSVFVPVASLPRTANGKLDRAALPDVDDMVRVKTEYVAPRNSTEERVCKVWEHVLELEQVGVLDNFFTLGGDSLMATKLVAALRDEFSDQELYIPYKEFFKSPVVDEVALYIERDRQRSELASKLSAVKAHVDDLAQEEGEL